MRASSLVLILPLLTIACPVLALAQDDTFWMMEGVTPTQKQIRYHLGLLGNRKIESASLPDASRANYYSEHQVALVVPMGPLTTSVLKFHSRVFQPASSFPSGRPLAGSLQDAQLGAVYRRVIAGNNQFGLGMFGGSASDRLLSSDTLVFETMAFYSWGIGKSQFISAFITYSNNRVVLNRVPLPGFAGKVEMGSSVGVLLGFPYDQIWIKPSDSTRLLAQADITNLRAKGRASYFLLSGMEFFAEAHSTVESYFRADRSVVSERLFYSEREATAGLNLNFFGTLMVEASAGLGYNRTLAEVENYSYRADNQRKMDDGFVMHFKSSLTF